MRQITIELTFYEEVVPIHVRAVEVDDEVLKCRSEDRRKHPHRRADSSALRYEWYELSVHGDVTVRGSAYRRGRAIYTFC